ncbi:Fur family transcriptional regulator [Chloroflexota bacterium]
MRGISKNTRKYSEAPLPGLRVTSQRRLLLELITQAQGHLDADELYRRAKEVEPGISLSTVYRNLRLFKKMRLVEERHLTQEHHHYEAKAGTEHHHLVCLGCGRVIEFESRLIGLMKSQVGKKEGFEITGTEVQLIGYCPQCLRNRTGSSEE